MSTIDKEKKIIEQQKNKIRWKFGAVLAAVGIIILATVGIILFTQLNNNKETETEVVTKVKKAVAQAKAISLNKVKKSVVQFGKKDHNLKKKTVLKQSEIHTWNNLYNPEIDLILTHIDHSVNIGGMSGELRKYGPSDSTETIWYIFFNELKDFVLNKEKRHLLVNSGQDGRNQKEQDLYLFIKMFHQGIDFKVKKDEQKYNFLLEKVENKFGSPFQKIFKKYFDAKWYFPKNTALSLMLIHILSDVKIKESNIK